MRKIMLFIIAWFVLSIPHSVQADGRLLFYNAQSGLGAVSLLDSAGNYTFVGSIPGFSTGWTHIVGTASGGVLFYNASTGLGATARIDSAGNYTFVGSIPGFSTGWTHIAGPGGVTQHRLQIQRFTTTTLTNADADSILNDASTVLQVSDGPDDVACPVALARSGDVGVFNTTDGSLDTAAELTAVFSLPGNVKVVDDVNFCANQFNTSYIGCGQTPGASFITERFTANQEGILWAHEFGHNQGLSHRDTSTNNVMYFSIGTNRRRVNQEECNAFMGQQGLIAMANANVRTQASTAGGAPMPVEEFVTQIYFEGLPLAQAATYGEEEVETLLRMLDDPNMVQFHENIALTLGMIGSERAVDPLISYINKGVGSTGATTSRPAYKGRIAAIVALGYLVNLSGSQKALSYLLESTSPATWAQRNIVGLAARESARSETETAGDLSKYAIIALGLSGHPTAAAHLRSLRDQEATATAGERSFRTEVKDELDQSLQFNEAISREGLLNFYKKPAQ
jgi:hypothetical protein